MRQRLKRDPESLEKREMLYCGFYLKLSLEISLIIKSEFPVTEKEGEDKISYLSVFNLHFYVSSTLLQS